MENPPSGISDSLRSSESSRTVSSKSAQSADVRDEDFTTDNVASPIDLECHIQAERITKILNEAVFKTTLALSLPSLVADYRTLDSALSQQHMDDLLFIFEQYESPFLSERLLDMEALNEIRSGTLSLKKRLSPELGHLLYILSSYPAVRPKVNEIVNKMRETYQPDMTEPSNQSLEFLLALEQFRDLMVKQMSITAAEELTAKLDTRRLETSNNKLKEKIAELNQLLKTEQENFQATMDMKTQTIAKLEADLQVLHYDANLKLKKKILDSERQMVLATRAHVVKNEMLKEEEVEVRQSFENLRNVNMAEEKALRARRFKVETQLLSWIQKYDLEMSEKQIELDELTEQFEEEVRKTRVCQAKLDEQDKEYIPLMAEREEEYHQEMLAKMNKFLKEHAARIIQHFWREVLANRAEKKKLRKQWQKIRAAKAAAAKAEELEAKKQAALKKKQKSKKDTIE